MQHPLLSPTYPSLLSSAHSQAPRDASVSSTHQRRVELREGDVGAGVTSEVCSKPTFTRARVSFAGACLIWKGREVNICACVCAPGLHVCMRAFWWRGCSRARARLRACLDFTVPTCPVCPDDLSMFATAWLTDECGIYLT